MSKERDQEWLEKALLCYEQEKSKNPEYLSFDDITIKTFARRIVGQIKEQMKLDNEQCEMLLKAIFKKYILGRNLYGTHSILFSND